MHTVQTANELLTLGRDEIETINTSKLSIMPEGIMDSGATPTCGMRSLI